MHCVQENRASLSSACLSRDVCYLSSVSCNISLLYWVSLFTSATLRPIGAPLQVSNDVMHRFDRTQEDVSGVSRILSHVTLIAVQQELTATRQQKTNCRGHESSLLTGRQELASTTYATASYSQLEIAMADTRFAFQHTFITNIVKATTALPFFLVAYTNISR